MKSKIWLDIDFDNKPVLKIKHYWSKNNINNEEYDLKDKVLENFLKNAKYISSDNLEDPSDLDTDRYCGLLSLSTCTLYGSDVKGDHITYEVYPIKLNIESINKFLESINLSFKVENKTKKSYAEESLNSKDSLKSVRKSGRTTRLVDKYIQELFEGKQVVIKDHNDTEENNNRLIKIIEHRLRGEHNLDRYSSNATILVDSKDNGAIKMKLNLDDIKMSSTSFKEEIL